MWTGTQRNIDMYTGMSGNEGNVKVLDRAPVARAPASGAWEFLKIFQSTKWRSMRRQDSKIFKVRNRAQIDNAIWHQEQMYRKCKEKFRRESTLLNVKGYV